MLALLLNGIYLDNYIFAIVCMGKGEMEAYLLHLHVLIKLIELNFLKSTSMYLCLQQCSSSCTKVNPCSQFPTLLFVCMYVGNKDSLQSKLGKHCTLPPITGCFITLQHAKDNNNVSISYNK